jgi:hypothetical protein
VDKSIEEARWLLIPVFGVVIVVALASILVG